MTGPFTDTYPDAPRILFVGLPDSSHTHSWMSLLDGEGFNVRLFGVHLVPNDWYIMLNRMPDDWSMPTYISAKVNYQVDPRVYYPANRRYWWEAKIRNRLENRLRSTGIPHQVRLFMDVIHEWQPDIIHTLGLEPAGYFVGDVMVQYPLEFKGKWVAQLRGGSDVTPGYHDPEHAQRVIDTCKQADWVLTDNYWNIDYLQSHGLTNIAPIAPVPGTGGIDIDHMARNAHQPTSQRNIVLIPKAYTSAYSHTLPIFEGVRNAADSLQDAEIHVVQPNFIVQPWILGMLKQFQPRLFVHENTLRREQFLTLLGKTRVMLSLSLVDGVPNVMYEAMAAGVVPILSPLETITPVVKDGEHVLFARNLYPDEIATQITRAMTDDVLVDRMAETNAHKVHELADRVTIRQKVIGFYTTLIDGRSNNNSVVNR